MKIFPKIAALILGVVLAFGFVSCESETDNSLALLLFALSSEKDCTITFDANGGTINTTTQTVKPRVKSPLKSASELELNRADYVFMGWSTKADSAKAEYNDEAEVILNGDITLYAVWLSLKPLTLEFIQSGNLIIRRQWSTLKYSLNGGPIKDATETIAVTAGDKVCLYAEKSEYTTIGTFQSIDCTADCYIYGNIMSLVTHTGNGKWNPLETTLKQDYTFQRLFSVNYKIKNHDTELLCLPATTLTRSCYGEMFYGCKNLKKAPALPAETLVEDCYRGMFRYCRGLTECPILSSTTLAKYCYAYMFDTCESLEVAPELPAKTLVDYCYQDMFYGCKSLKTAPELPAEDLAFCCYFNMFAECTSLTKAPKLPAKKLAEWCYGHMFSRCSSLSAAPELPVEELVDCCYMDMFEKCTSLTTAPVLPAKTLVHGCYQEMFLGCSNLNSIKCLATDVSKNNCTDNWLYNVSSSGTFIKAKDMTSWGSGDGGIPTGWTVVDAE